MGNDNGFTVLIPRDFLIEGRWLTSLSGFSQSRSFGYMMYRVFLFAVLAYMFLMEVLACVFKPEKQLMLQGTHSFLGTFMGICALMARLLAHRSINMTKAIIKSGVYLYNKEEKDEDLLRLKAMIPKEINSKSRVFVGMFIAGPLSNAIILPAVQALMLDPEVAADTSVVNPYLPHIFYQPFDTTTPVGFVSGAILGFLYFYCLYAVIVGSNWVYLNCAVEIKIQMQVLNHSLKNIQKRASLMYTKLEDERSRIPESLLTSKKFDSCLLSCLRSNVQHHQALLRLLKASSPFCRAYLLDIFALASLVFGVQLYLINQNPPMSMMISLVASFVAEQFTVVYLCTLGEDVINESEKIFSRLYRISWFNYSKRVKQIVHIMMTNTLKPIELKGMVFGVPASLEIYGDIVTAMYKITSLVRNSDVV